VLAFCIDPVARWPYPDPRQYLVIFTALVRAFGGKAFAQGTARPVNRCASAALEATLPVGREAEFAAIFEEMARCHPSEAHWYLPLIGVDPAHQRKGCGAALPRETLET
jgi:GNAT superfamily N-acetyltransferase